MNVLFLLEKRTNSTQLKTDITLFIYYKSVFILDSLFLPTCWNNIAGNKITSMSILADTF